jgi:hypothetical protein
MKNSFSFFTVVGALLLAGNLQSYGQVPPAPPTPEMEPTSEDLYNLDSKMAEKLTALKYDPSTKHTKISYAIDNTGSTAKLTLYYQNNRLVRLENYTYDQNNQQVSYSLFDFNERNGCVYVKQWNKNDYKKYTLTLSEYGLIYFSDNMKLIKLDPSQMQKLIQETKDSLNIMMGHFKGFKYTFEIK